MILNKLNKNIKYIIHNGEFELLKDFRLLHTNRSFRYGDALFETIHAYGAKIQFFTDHFNRLTSSMLTLNMEIPADFNTNGLDLKIHKLLDRNKLYMGARVRLTVYRSEAGFYTPETNKTDYLIETEELTVNKYILNEKGLQIEVFKKLKKPINILSNLKSANSLIFVMAGIYKNANNLDDCIILNEEGNICEFVSSNIFMAKDNVIYTPPVTSGCINGIMRRQVISIAKNYGLKVIENNIKPNILSQVDEIFLTNAINGIQWIGGYKKKRYFCKVSTMLSEKLNEMVF